MKADVSSAISANQERPDTGVDTRGQVVSSIVDRALPVRSRQSVLPLKPQRADDTVLSAYLVGNRLSGVGLKECSCLEVSELSGAGRSINDLTRHSQSDVLGLPARPIGRTALHGEVRHGTNGVGH